MEERGQREARILARTFRDRLTVRRAVWVKDPQTEESKQIEEIVYEDIICAYSQASSGMPQREASYSTASRESVLFTVPGVELLDNDLATVVTEAGQTFQGRTGRTFGYISHGETPFAAERLA